MSHMRYLFACAVLLIVAACAEGKSRLDASDVDGSPNTDAPPGTPDGSPDANVGPQPITITHSASESIAPVNSASCNQGTPGFYHTENSYYRVFILSNFSITSAFSITSVDVGIETAAGATGSQPATLNLYTLSGVVSVSNLSSIGSTPVTITDQTESILNIPISATAPAGSTLVVELLAPDGTVDLNSFFIGSNTAGETAAGYIRAPAEGCAITDMTTTTAIGFPQMHIVMNVNGIHIP